MIEFLGADGNVVFTFALLLVFGFAALELVGTLLFGGFAQALDGLLPDVDFDLDLDLDVDTDVDLDIDLHAGGALMAPGVLAQALVWLQLGKVPLLFWILLFLTGFALSGLALQLAIVALGFRLLPGWLASVPAFCLALPFVRGAGGVVGRWLPKEETSAVSTRTFVGRVARVVLGTARPGQPAQARLRDLYGRTHYVMVEPDLPDMEFPTGTHVLLVSEVGARFRAIPAPADTIREAESS